MLNVYCDELIGKIVDFQGKKYLMVHGCTLDKVLDKNKRIGIEKLDDTTFWSIQMINCQMILLSKMLWY